MTDAPHVLLTRAADRIKNMASAASPGPWAPSGVGDFGWGIIGPSGGAEFEDSAAGRADADWVSALSPAVAPHLVAWLRQSASMYRLYSSRWSGTELDRKVTGADVAALGFARCVLGLETQEDQT